VPNSVDVKSYILDGGEIKYREVGSDGPWTWVGPTIGDATATITSKFFIPPQLTGVTVPIKGMRRYIGGTAEIKFTTGEISGDKMSLAIPGAVVDTALTTEAEDPHLDSTLDGGAPAGDTELVVHAATNAAAGDFFAVGTGATVEYRQITEVDGTTIAFRDPLRFDHDDDEIIFGTVGDGRTTISPPISKVLPAGAWKEWALILLTDAGPWELRLDCAVSSSDSVVLTVGDEKMAGVDITLGAEVDGANLSNPLFRMIVPTAALGDGS
jgi:hypothetical protein